MRRPSLVRLVRYTRSPPTCSSNRGHVLFLRLKPTVLIEAYPRSPPLRKRPTACPRACLRALARLRRLPPDVLPGLLLSLPAQCGNRALLLESRSALRTQCYHRGVVAPSPPFDTGVNWPRWKKDL